MTKGKITVWFNGACSKCRGLKEILDSNGLDFEFRFYLENPPSMDELEGILDALGSDNPMLLVREKDPSFQELNLEGASREALLSALTVRPSMLQRPILVQGDTAVIARPPEKALEILDV